MKADKIVVKLGMLVDGEFARGEVIAITKEWCIYRTTKGEEFAENWDAIHLVFEQPSENISPMKEKDLERESLNWCPGSGKRAVLAPGQPSVYKCPECQMTAITVGDNLDTVIYHTVFNLGCL